jgi:2-polyprenyl-3-methyl-5-hydroxy-6-metoxy-1,4-benzoquinol methylase
MNWLGDLIQKEVDDTITVLDVGCGIMQATDGVKCKSILGCDFFPKYLSHIKNLWPTVRVSVEELDRFVDDSFDVVFCIDVIEHLEKELALKVISELKRIARWKVIVYTPNSFSDNHTAVENAWGLGYNEGQYHKCLFVNHELTKLGFKVDNKNPDRGNYCIWVK